MNLRVFTTTKMELIYPEQGFYYPDFYYSFDRPVLSGIFMIGNSITRQLRGEPLLTVEPVERISDVWVICQNQMEKEKENLSIFEEALTIAKANPVKKARGIIGDNIRMLKDIPSDMVQRSTVIELLKVLALDEKRHIKLLDTVIFDLTEHRNNPE